MKRLLLLLALGGCYHEPLQSAPTDNKDIQVETLFTYEGITVYRFLDERYHYFTSCGQAISSQRHQAGKIATYHEENL